MGREPGYCGSWRASLEHPTFHSEHLYSLQRNCSQGRLENYSPNQPTNGHQGLTRTDPDALAGSIFRSPDAAAENMRTLDTRAAGRTTIRASCIIGRGYFDFVRAMLVRSIRRSATAVQGVCSMWSVLYVFYVSFRPELRTPPALCAEAVRSCLA